MKKQSILICLILLITTTVVLLKNTQSLPEELLPKDLFLEMIMSEEGNFHFDSLVDDAMRLYKEALEKKEGVPINILVKDIDSEKINEWQDLGRVDSIRATLTILQKDKTIRYTKRFAKINKVYIEQVYGFKNEAIADSNFSRKFLGKSPKIMRLKERLKKKKEVIESSPEGYEDAIEYLYEYSELFRLLTRVILNKNSHRVGSNFSESEMLSLVWNSFEDSWWRAYSPTMIEKYPIKTMMIMRKPMASKVILLLLITYLAVGFVIRYVLYDFGKVDSCLLNIFLIPIAIMDRKIHEVEARITYRKSCEDLLQKAQDVLKNFKDKESAQEWMKVLEDTTSDIKSKQQMLQKLKDRLIQEQTPVRIRTAYWLKDDLPNGNGSIAKRTKKQDPNQEQRKQILKKIQNWGGSGSLTEDFIKSLGKNKLDLLEEIFDLLNGNKELKRAFLDLRPSRMSSYINSKQSNFYKAVEAKDVKAIKSILLDS